MEQTVTLELRFEHRHDYGKSRFYPVNREARCIVELTGRKCLRDVELQRLQYAGFTVRVTHRTDGAR